MQIGEYLCRIILYKSKLLGQSIGGFYISKDIIKDWTKYTNLKLQQDTPYIPVHFPQK